MTTDIIQKHCPVCKQTKPASEFHKNKAQLDGLSSYCGACVNQRAIKRRYPNGRTVMTKGEQFWSRVNKTEGCWIWTAGTDSNGYGQFCMRRKGRLAKGHGAHIISYELAYGEVPDGLCVLHHCDNPPCVRPDHLFLGTHADNMKDMVRKGRSHNGHAELTAEQVHEIRARYAAGGITYRELGEIYHKHPSYLQNLIKRRYWKHLE